jgi:hypothetical protein
MVDRRACRCDTLRGTGEFSVRRLPSPEVSFEALCVTCETRYWLGLPEAERAIDPEIVRRGRAALEQTAARGSTPEAARARATRERFSALRPVRDALVLAARRILRFARAGRR